MTMDEAGAVDLFTAMILNWAHLAKQSDRELADLARFLDVPEGELRAALRSPKPQPVKPKRRPGRPAAFEDFEF